MGRRSQRLAVAGSGVEEPPESETLPPSSPVIVKEKRRRRSEKKPADKENRAEPEVAVDPVFPRRREDGTTSLAILTAGEGILPGTDRDRPVTLGNLLGRVRYGAASIQGFKEDRRNQAKPMYPIFYPGGYSSHGPTYDSTFANMTSSQSKMVAPYFDLRKLENEEVIQRVCSEADYSHHFVDHILNLLDGKDIGEAVVETEKKDKEGGGDVDFDYLSTLESEGIDMSFLSNLQATLELKNEPEMAGLSIEQQLDLTAELISNLQAAQNTRISASPPANLNAINPPSSREMKLAERLVSGLSRLTSLAQPGQVVEPSNLRKALGVVLPSPEVKPASDNIEPPLTNGH